MRDGIRIVTIRRTSCVRLRSFGNSNGPDEEGVVLVTLPNWAGDAGWTDHYDALELERPARASFLVIRDGRVRHEASGADGAETRRILPEAALEELCEDGDGALHRFRSPCGHGVLLVPGRAPRAACDD